MLRRGRDRSTVCHGMSRPHSLVGSIVLCISSLYTMETPNWTQCLDARRKVQKCTEGATHIPFNLKGRGKSVNGMESKKSLCLQAPYFGIFATLLEQMVVGAVFQHRGVVHVSTQLVSMRN